MFEQRGTPRVFALPVGADFGRGFLDGLLARLQGQPPEALARVLIYVNTRRTATRLHDMLVAGGALLLPDIRLITDLANDPTAPVNLPPRLSPLRRKLYLAQLISGYLDQNASAAPRTSIFDLADSLCELLDEFHSEGVPLDRLQDLDVGDHSAHWERSREFLSILIEFLGGHDLSDEAAQLFTAAEATARHWQANPPEHPVIVAGSTGSRGATALFMRAVAQLPQGAVVLPGLDRHMAASTARRLAEDDRITDHAQTALARFCGRLGLRLDQVSTWHDEKALSNIRNKLLSLALTPAPVTYSWLEQGPAVAPHLTEALDKVSLIEAPTRKEEAAAIALCLRKAVEDNRRSALITPDRDLARRVGAELSRWAILPDDSGGEPLHLTPPGIFLRLVADMFSRELTPKSLISILKHPLADSCSDDRVAHLQNTRKLEIELRKGRMPEVSLANLAEIVGKWDDPASDRWADWVKTVLQGINKQSFMPLSKWVSLHRATAESIAAGPTGSEQNELWRKDAGEKARRLLDELAGEADAGGMLTTAEYRALLDTLLQAQSEREAAITHPLVSIWGTLEARVQGADLVVLAGLNEGTWPKMPKADPWLNRTMRQQIGLPSPERQIGLSAHDFQQACGGAEIVWSRSLRDGDAPSVASRWVIRITNLLDGLGDPGKEALENIRARGNYWLDLAKSVERPEALVPPANRPSPRVPLAAKPAGLSVTRIAPLINDPYQIYADAVLKLRPLDPLTPEMDAKVRGTVFHEILEAFSMPGVELTEAELLRIARQKLDRHVGPPETRELWLGRIATLAGWIVEEEAKRQERCPESWREIRGARDLPDLDFTLSAKADRIGRTTAGELVVYDYKTGAAPGPTDIERYEKQLPLEAAIIAAGGFAEVPATPVKALEYMSLASGGKISSLSTKTKDGDDMVETTWRDFERLITTVRSDAFGFTARDRPANIKYPSDYDHLARFGEWQDTDPPVPEDMS